MQRALAILGVSVLNFGVLVGSFAPSIIVTGHAAFPRDASCPTRMLRGPHCQLRALCAAQASSRTAPEDQNKDEMRHINDIIRDNDPEATHLWSKLPEVLKSEFSYTRVLGRGAFGIVVLGHRKIEGPDSKGANVYCGEL